jgi:N-acetylmuramic acid 6-phosphate etherase
MAGEERVTMTAELTTQSLPTEGRNPTTVEIDLLPTMQILNRINDADRDVPDAVRHALPHLTALIDAAVPRFRSGGVVHYFGAGTSGRLGALDAAEIPPTYSVAPDRFVAHIAGGTPAITEAVEEVEDDSEGGEEDAAAVGPDDIAIGIAASGRTPYVAGALRRAQRAGALTAVITSNPGASLATVADFHLCAPTGPEVVAGSTRMKAATAAKLLLNAFSTALMIRLGKTYSNLMIDVAANNSKLRQRKVAVLVQATGAEEHICTTTLATAGDDLRVALVSLLAEVSPVRARAVLEAVGQNVRNAVADCLRN